MQLMSLSFCISLGYMGGLLGDDLMISWGCMGDFYGISWGYLWDIWSISWEHLEDTNEDVKRISCRYLGDILGIFGGYLGISYKYPGNI